MSSLYFSKYMYYLKQFSKVSRNTRAYAIHRILPRFRDIHVYILVVKNTISVCVDFPSPHEITPLIPLEQEHRGILAPKNDTGKAAREIFDYIGLVMRGVSAEQNLESYRELSGERQRE